MLLIINVLFLSDTKRKYISQDLLDFCHTEDYQDDIQIEIKLTLNNEEVQQTEQIKVLINRYKSKIQKEINQIKLQTVSQEE